MFGVLVALGAVNVYVFFFNQKTAPREVLKPSSFVDERTNAEDVVRESPREIQGKTPIAPEPAASSPASSTGVRATAPKLRPPVPNLSASASPARKQAPVPPAPTKKAAALLRPAQPSTKTAIARPPAHHPARPAPAAPAKRLPRP